MRLSRGTWWILFAWAVLAGSYAVASLLLPPGPGLTAFGDVAQCLVPLFANAGLLLNAASPDWRKNSFWMLLALGCTMWLAGQLLWTYFEIYLYRPTPNPFPGDPIFFLHVVPMIAALALQPHQRWAGRNFRYGYLDFSLLLFWWVYLYLFVVIPWQYVVPVVSNYGHNYNVLATVENLSFVLGLGVLSLRTRRPWRAIYGNLFGAAACYACITLVINVFIDERAYHTGSLYDVPLVASFVWFGTAGIFAYRRLPKDEAAPGKSTESSQAPAAEGGDYGIWPARLAMGAVLSLPVLAALALFAGEGPQEVRDFRLTVTLVSMVPMTALVFLRQRLVDGDRLRLLRESQESLENLKRLQMQFVQSEKLASLGQLAAGAAHEINNPLTAILGYSDLLIDSAELGEKPRSIAAKIREQARRTKTLVTNLLSFARQVPAERSLLDVNTIVSSAIQLRGLDLRGKSIQIELQTESHLPGIRGDANQLLQVFFNIISNAVDAMEEVGGGTLTVKTYRERASVVIEFSDTGPGIREPHLVFDPFYTTKPVGKGTGLGLSICYGLMKEHGGQISCSNWPEGGATFRLELPAVMALLSSREATLPKAALTEQAPPSTRVKPS